LRHYIVLTHLPELTEAYAADENTFLFISNDTTHNGVMLKEPEYEPAAVVDNTAYDRAHPTRANADGREIAFTTDNQLIHYHALAASMIQLGKWMDYLKEQGVYDNTRIIIVSDHGRALHLFEETILGNDKDYEDIVTFTGLLMVKDFDSHTFRTDPQFMTTADTPTLAFSGLIENPVNPFTGNPIDDTHKQDSEQYILTTFVKNFVDIKDQEQILGLWYRVEGHDVYNRDNWTELVGTPDEW
jgi:Arylsulfatase A and related enzymes